MCGIFGIYAFDRERPIDREQVKRQTHLLSHRGPDDAGFFSEDGIALGHRRLSVIDVRGGHQPMWDVERRVGVVFNGEIYNYRALRSELEQRGHRFRTQSDTEVILHGYREWGSDCVSKFHGMFALAVVDRVRRSLFLARDRLGKKPLYYFVDRDRFVFASEMKAILGDPSVPRVIDPHAVADFFAFHYVPGPGTIFQNIYKLPPAHMMHVEGEQIRRQSYWDVESFEPEDGSLAERIDVLDAQLEEAVRARMHADVPLGAFLSGGVDSSLIVALMQKQHGTPVRTQTVGFDATAYDERAAARDTASRLKTEHSDQVVRVDAASELERLVWSYDEPFADASALPTYALCRAARKDVTVALSGDGGDENFGGYRRYVFAMYEDRIRQALPTWFSQTVVRSAARVYPKADYLPRVFRAKATLRNLSVDSDRAYFFSLTDRNHRRVLDSDFSRGLRDYDPFHHFERHLSAVKTKDPLRRLQYLDLKTYLVDDILVKVDRASMAHGLEVRCPLLDHHLVELALALPSELKVVGRQTKIALRRLAKRWLPESVLTRPKQGFVVPLPQWFRGALKPRAAEALLSPGAHGSDFLDRGGLRRLWMEHQAGVRDHARTLWAALVFEAWGQRFLGQAPIVSPSSAPANEIAENSV